MRKQSSDGDKLPPILIDDTARTDDEMAQLGRSLAERISVSTLNKNEVSFKHYAPKRAARNRASRGDSQPLNQIEEGSSLQMSPAKERSGSLRKSRTNGSAIAKRTARRHTENVISHSRKKPTSRRRTMDGADDVQRLVAEARHQTGDISQSLRDGPHIVSRSRAKPGKHTQVNFDHRSALDHHPSTGCVRP